MAPSPPPVSPGLVVTPARQEASTPSSGSAGTVIVILVIVLVLLIVLVIAGYFFLRRRNKATKGTIVITRDLDTSTNLGRIIDKEPQLPPPRKQPEPLPSTAAVAVFALSMAVQVAHDRSDTCRLRLLAFGAHYGAGSVGRSC